MRPGPDGPRTVLTRRGRLLGEDVTARILSPVAAARPPPAPLLGPAAAGSRLALGRLECQGASLQDRGREPGDRGLFFAGARADTTGAEKAPPDPADQSEKRLGDMDLPELDDRKAEILRAIVEEYVETAQPVGSQTVARSSHLGVSSATVRNDMTVLERDGFIAQPHTSAGRIPTDLGYRYFVDHFADRGPLPAPQRRAVSDFFASTHRALEELLNETSQLLARVSRHAAMVVGPQPDIAHVRSVQLVPLHPNLALVVAVLSNGAVEREVVDIDVDDELRSPPPARTLDGQLRGHAWVSLPDLQPTGDPDVDRIATAARDALVRPARAGARRAALRRRREPPRGRARGVLDHRERGAPARDARAPGRRRLARA